ncbi:MAG: integrase [Bryobacteraceae bacterium]
MIVSMQGGECLSLEQIRAFLEASDEVQFEGRDRGEVYSCVSGTLRQHGYRELGRESKGLLRRYLAKMTGLSRAQVTRLVGQYRRQGEVKPKQYRRHRFGSLYTRADIELLAAVDEAHETLSGPATQKVLQREFHDYGHRQYERLARISVAHLYRLRRTRTYRNRRVVCQTTRPTKVAIGERRRPRPEGRPGYLRVDTVHQGDRDGVKGLYHVNAVDEVTQWQVVGATAQISEAWLLPVLADMLEQFPFRIRGFHSDNGSEYINEVVANLLSKLLVEQTKSRPRHCNDNALAECKNGAVIRKHMGFGHIAAPHAEAIAVFYKEHFNPYLNFHRPCGVPEEIDEGKGKIERIFDLFHARQHVWDLARKLFPMDKAERECWITTEQDHLDEGRIEELVCSLRSIQVADPDLAEEIRTQAEYFNKNAERMRYPRFRDQHLFVGSGVIEAGCKTVIGARLKQSGMFWTVRGANAILALRCCHMNGEFEDYWESRAA